jgi:hypothetical protein
MAFVGKRRPELGLDNAILDCGELKSCLIHARFSCDDSQSCRAGSAIDI